MQNWTKNATRKRNLFHMRNIRKANRKVVSEECTLNVKPGRHRECLYVKFIIIFKDFIHRARYEVASPSTFCGLLL